MENTNEEKSFEMIKQKPETKLCGIINHLLNEDRYDGKEFKLVNKFLTTVRENIKEELLTSMNYNLYWIAKNFDFKKSIFYDIEKFYQYYAKNMCTIGAYSLRLNKIFAISSERWEKVKKLFPKEKQRKLEKIINLRNEGSELLFFHELLHMASANKEDKINLDSTKKKEDRTIYCGFCQSNKSGRVAEKFNEGYTELLVEKLFYDRLSRTDSITYDFYYVCALLVEKVVGEDKMIQLYFENDLKGLCTILGEYTTEKLTIKFIKNLDNLNENNIEEIVKYLEVLLKNKNSLDMINGNISSIEFLNNLEKIDMSLTLLESKAKKVTRTAKRNYTRKRG